MVPEQAVRDAIKLLMRRAHARGEEGLVVHLCRRLTKTKAIAKKLEEAGFSATKEGDAWIWEYSPED